MEAKRGLERILATIFPTLQLEGTSWLALWQQDQREKYRIASRNLFLWIAGVYVLHFFAVDTWRETGEFRFFFLYRFGVASGFALTWLYANTKHFSESGFYKLPGMLSFVAASVLQVISTAYEPRIPMVFSFVVPVLGIWALSLSYVMSAMVFGLQAILLGYLTLKISGSTLANVNMVVSGYLVGLITLLALRSSYFLEVKFFLSNQEFKTRMREQLEEKQDLFDQIRSFMPLELFRRVVEAHQVFKKTFAHAVDEILRTRSQNVVCLHSDIRGYTKAARDTSLLRSSIIPEIRDLTKIVDDEHGVPKLIGDLILSYFDDRDDRINITRGWNTAVRIAMHSLRRSQSASNEPIQRFVIMSYGPALVGNIGATDASREITCMGPCVNILQRIDEMTKEPSFQSEVPFYSLVITPEAFAALQAAGIQLNAKRLIMQNHQLKIRSFEDVDALYIVTPDSIHNIQTNAPGKEAA